MFAPHPQSPISLNTFFDSNDNDGAKGEEKKSSSFIHKLRTNPWYKLVAMGDFAGVKRYLQEQPYMTAAGISDESCLLAQEQHNLQMNLLFSLLQDKPIFEATDEHIFLLLSCIVSNDVILLGRLLRKFNIGATNREMAAELYYTAIRCKQQEALSQLLQSDVRPAPFAIRLAFQYNNRISDIDRMWGLLLDQEKLQAMEDLIIFHPPTRQETLPLEVQHFYVQHTGWLLSKTSYRAAIEASTRTDTFKVPSTKAVAERKIADITYDSIVTNIMLGELSVACLKIKTLIDANDKKYFYSMLGALCLQPDLPGHGATFSLLMFCNRCDVETVLHYLTNDSPSQFKKLWGFVRAINQQNPHYTIVHQWLSHLCLENMTLDVASFKKMHYLLNSTSESATDIDPGIFSNPLTMSEYRALCAYCEKLGNMQIILEQLQVFQIAQDSNASRAVSDLPTVLEKIVLAYLPIEQRKNIYLCFPASKPQEVNIKNREAREAQLQEIDELCKELQSFKKWCKFRAFLPAIPGGSWCNFFQLMSIPLAIAVLIAFIYSSINYKRIINNAINNVTSDPYWPTCKFIGYEIKGTNCNTPKHNSLDGCEKLCEELGLVNINPWRFVSLFLGFSAFILMITTIKIIFESIPRIIQERRDPLAETLPEALRSRLQQVATIHENSSLTDNVPVSVLLNTLQSQANKIRHWLDVRSTENFAVEIKLQEQLSATDHDLQAPLLRNYH